MVASVRSFSILQFFLFYASVVNCWNLEEISEKVDHLTDTKSLRITRDSDDNSPIWLEYEFNTGAGNREELVVTDISVQEYANLLDTGTDWQFLEVNDTCYLARAEKSILSFYKLDFDDTLTGEPVNLNIEGTILTYKVIALNSFRSNNDIEIDIVAVVCVDSDSGTSLRWFRLLNQSTFQFFWSWPVQKHIKDMAFVQQGNRNTLLLLDENEMRFGKRYSLIDVYGFTVDFSTKNFHFWLSQRILPPKIFDIQVCSIYETISLALQGVSDVHLYEYQDTTAGSIFQELQTIKSQDLKNFVCFESGYLQFLATSGPEAGLFHFFEGEFQYNTESESSFDTSQISWIQDLRLNTYREESLLLIQLKNSTVIALGWQGLSFKRVQLPSNILDQYDLSKVTVIPKFGFVLGNRFVRFHTELKNLKHPTQHTTERLLSIQGLLNHSLNHQEKILEETEARLEKSYLKSPMITGFLNVSTVNATNAIIGDNVTYQTVTMGSANLTKEELNFDVNAYADKLNDLKMKLDEIESNLIDALDSNSTEVHFDSNVEVFGNLNVAKNLNVENLTVNFINDVNMLEDLDSDDENAMINGRKTFSSIEAENLTIYTLNGIPVSNIRFGDSIVDYSGVDLSKINRAKIDGHLSFSTINGVEWKKLMEKIVWKNREAFVPGNTIIEGTMTAKFLLPDVINNLLYPDDYVLIDDDVSANVTGSKSFNSLQVIHLERVNTINDINFDDFIILNKDNVLDKEITFENLSVVNTFQVDGDVTGLANKEIQFLNETSKISSDIIFLDVTVLGNVTFENLFLSKQLLNFDDLLLRTESNVEIIGTKTFLGNVDMKSNVTITSGIINGHPIDEFATLDTDQQFPNLKKISANVTFGNVTFGAIEKLETLFKTNASKDCLEKIIVLKSPIIVDELSFDYVQNVSYEDFSKKLQKAFENVRFENLTLKTLEADEIVPVTINGIDYANFSKRLASSRVVDEITVENLETDRVNAKFINGMSLEEINLLNNRINGMLDKIYHGNVTLNSLRVTGKIEAKSINGVDFQDLFEIRNVIFKENVSIGNLTILGSMNGFNLSEKMYDTVLKTDRPIKIDGHKIFDNINCHKLEAISLNGRPVENVLDPLKEQVLKGPVVVNGSVTVLKNFNSTGKIGNVLFKNLADRFQSLGNNTYKLHGNVRFSNDNVSIESLYANGSIQGTSFDDFLKSVIFKDEDNVTISGNKTFKNFVTFNDAFTVRDKLNDVDLKRFHENAIFIDKPFSVKSKIVFKDGIKIEKNLAVNSSFNAESVMGVDLNELKFNVLYLNRPTYIKESITFTDVTFESDIVVEKFNDLNMRLLIPLHTDQIIPVEVLKCGTVNVEEIKVLGKINGENLEEIKANTFMARGSQNITGHMNFTGNVHIRRNFNARIINGIDPKKVIPLNSKSTLTGNFVFESPIIFNQSLRVLGYLNGINPNQWEAVAVTDNHAVQSIVSGKWTVFGNVYFQNGASGNEILNGLNVTELSNTLAERHLEMDAAMARINDNMENMCEDLNQLKHDAENQIYRFSAFDYLQIIEFDSNIVSVHNFELEDLDYLMISYNTCHMHTYLFTGTKFELVADIVDFGTVDRWTTFTDKEALYFLTSGGKACGRSPVNLWKLKNDEFTHVLDLGQKIDSRKVNRDMFLMMINNKDERSSSERIHEELEKSISSLEDEDDVKIVLDEDQMMLTSRRAIYMYDVDRSNSTSIDKKSSGSSEVLNFKVGVFEKEMFLYFDEDVSKNRIFICNNDAPQKKILQTIRTHRPSSFAVLNFEGSIETLLVFLENKKNLRIYEYKGIQGFVYRDTIKMDVDKLFSFKIRKYPNLAKRYCLALIHHNRLTILQANMYGEKLNMDTLTCSNS